MHTPKKYKARIQESLTGEIHEEIFEEWLDEEGNEACSVDVMVRDHFYTKLDKEPFDILDIDEITDSDYSNTKETKLFELTEGQMNAKKGIISIVKQPYQGSPRFCTLSGPAGSGKSTVLQYIIENLDSFGEVGLCAPTHKAAKVLRKMAYERGIDHLVDIRTIHSALGITMKQVDGDEVIHRDPYAEEKEYDYLFIDECSMLGDDILQYIIECRSKNVIFVGDICQISPVDAEDGEVSKTFSEVEDVFMLDEVVRQAADNPIISLATKFRECQDVPTYNERTEIEEEYGIPPSLNPENMWPHISNDVDENGNGIITLPRNVWFDTVLDIFKSDEFKSDPDHCRCLAYKNSTVDMINTTVRKRIHGDDVPEFLVGEVIVAQSMGPTWKNAEEFRILEITEDVDTEYEVPCWILKLTSLDTNLLSSAKVVKKEYESRFNDRLSKIAAKARLDKASARMHWKEFWGMKKRFSTFKHVYAMTFHKSQGSTFDQTFIYTPDVLTFDFTILIKQLMYTGITRSRNTTVFAT